MRQARKHRLFGRWFAAQVRKRLRQQFEGVHVRGLSAFVEAASQGPLVVVANHVAYWDSLLAIALVTGELDLDGYALMEGASLDRHPYLGRVGGFGVERDKPGDGEAVVAYGASRLDRPGRVVWVYPEGREQPAGRRPLVFKRGAASMVLAAEDARWVPVAVQYVYGQAERASVYLSFGAPQSVDRMGEGAQTVALRQAAAVTTLLTELDRVVETRVDTGALPDDFRTVLHGRRDRVGAALAALLARLTR